jgi:hypothetical protein
MGDFMATIRRLPVPTVSAITEVVEENSVILYKLLIMASIPRLDQLDKSGNSHQAMAADGLAFHSRFLSYRIWLWFTTLKFLDEKPKQANKSTTSLVSNWVSEMTKTLDRTQGLFPKTNWAMREDLVLWMSALGILVSTDAQDVLLYINQFRCVTGSVVIDNQAHLQKIMSPFPPLDRVRTDRLDRLWLLLRRADKSSY